MCKKDDCTGKDNKKYGGYCYKDRRAHLVDINTNRIKVDSWTDKCSDYLKEDIFRTLLYLVSNGETPLVNGESILFKDKKYVFPLLSLEINKLKKYDGDDIKKIVKIQVKFKSKMGGEMNNLRGEGYKDKIKCNNETDFFTYDSISEIEDKYFFSYKDNSGFIWFFDIRSFNKLIEMGQGNPYTREEISSNVKGMATKLSVLLKLTSEDDLVNDDVLRLTREQIIKQKTIDIFSQMEQFGYGCNIEWFLDLNPRRLKNLYKNLEDIWNYRLNLSYEVKSRISPPNGIAFNIPIVEVNNIMGLLQLQEIILNEVMKFNNALTDEDKKLGLMYFLLGMGLVSRECYDAHQWIIHAVY
jgi:hypothetical protein